MKIKEIDRKRTPCKRSGQERVCKSLKVKEIRRKAESRNKKGGRLDEQKSGAGGVLKGLASVQSKITTDANMDFSYCQVHS